MAHILLLVLLAAWAGVVLRDRPLREYAAIYFVAGLVGFLAEFVFSGVLQFYHLRTHLMASQFHDVRLTAFFDKLGNLPLIAVLFAHYCTPYPVWKVVGGGAALGMLEVIFLELGAIEYRNWSPLLTTAFFAAYFGLIWWLTVATQKIPRWLHVDAFAFWAAFLVDVLFHGAFWLWHYDVPIMGDPRGDSRIFALLITGFLVAPVATVVSLNRRFRGWTLPLAAAAGLWLVEVVGVASGWVVYDGWTLWLAALRLLLAVGLPVLYVRRFLERRPAWVPPVQPRRTRH